MQNINIESSQRSSPSVLRHRRTDGSDLSQKKSGLKIYNSMYHNFDYEHHAKQKRTFAEMIADRSTPSNVSEHSIIIHNDVYHVIPAVRELIYLAECYDENTITRQEAFALMKKLRIAQNHADPRRIFKTLHFSNDIMRIEDFFAFFTTDIKTIDYKMLTKEEIILKFGSEIYRAVGKESTYIEVKDVIDYLKEHKSLGFDLTQMFELFDFYKNEISRMLKTKLTILSFFHKNAPILHQVFTADIIKRLNQITNTFRQDHLNSTTAGPSNQTTIRLYDPEKDSRLMNSQNLENKLSRTITYNKCEQEPQIGMNYNNNDGNINTNVKNILLEKDFRTISRDLEIEDYFFEVQPKNKGWLMRKSKKRNNKWAMVFCEIHNGRFTSVKPSALKKSIEIKHIEMHKCNFLELMNRLEFPLQQDNRRGHRRTGSQGQKTERGLNGDGRSASNIRQTTQQNTQQTQRLDFFFFVLDTQTQKTYLIRSPENMLIGSIIHFYLNKDKYLNMYSEFLNPMLCVEPEYSGVIEVAICTKKSIDRYHSTLKSYSFKKQFLIIKNGKFNIYEMKVKDNLNLVELAVQSEDQLDLLPQTNPFLFSIEKLDSQKIKNNKKELNVPHEDYGISKGMRPLTPAPKRLETDIISHLATKEALGRVTEPEYNELDYLEEKKTPKNYFQSFFQSLVGSKKKKSEKITLACDTQTKPLNRSKMATKESFLQPHDDALPKTSFQNEFDSYGLSTGTERRKKKNKSSLTVRNNQQENNDFYDVFSAKHNEEKEEKNGSEDFITSYGKIDKNNMPLITEPDANNLLDSEEVLLTFTQFNAENLPLFLVSSPNAGQQINFEDPSYLFPNEIKTFTDIELWQKFVLFFVKEAHQCSNFDLKDETMHSHNSTQARLGRPSQTHPVEGELIEDEPLIRLVLTENYRTKNY